MEFSQGHKMEDQMVFWMDSENPAFSNFTIAVIKDRYDPVATV